MVNPNKRTISFNEEFHRYTDEYNKVYTSVTTVIQNYYPKFDEEHWSKYTANKLGISQSAVKQNWKEGRDFACEKGTIEHKLLEDSINDSKKTWQSPHPTLFPKGFLKSNEVNYELLKQSPLGIKYPEILKKLKEFIDAGYKVYVEKRVYWADFLIAGTIDCLLVKDGKFWIIDWKTNKDELKFKSGYYKKVNGVKTNEWVDKKEYFFKPLNNLENCKGNIYTIQLSLYAYLLELWGLQCEGLLLYHIRDVPVKDAKGSLVYDSQGKVKTEKIVKPYDIIYQRIACELLTIDHKNALTSKNNNNNTTLFTIT